MSLMKAAEMLLHIFIREYVLYKFIIQKTGASAIFSWESL